MVRFNIQTTFPNSSPDRVNINSRWATIAATTFMIRLLVFRLVIEGQKHNVRLQAVSPQMTELTSRIKQATVEKDQVGIQLAQGALQGLFKKHDVHPLRAIKVPLVQFPVFLSMFYGLRRLAEAPLPQFLEGGFSWVTDLTATDPYLILPLLSVVLTNVVIRVGQTLVGGKRSALTPDRRGWNGLASG